MTADEAVGPAWPARPACLTVSHSLWTEKSDISTSYTYSKVQGSTITIHNIQGGTRGDEMAVLPVCRPMATYNLSLHRCKYAAYRPIGLAYNKYPTYYCTVVHPEADTSLDDVSALLPANSSLPTHAGMRTRATCGTTVRVCLESCLYISIYYASHTCMGIDGKGRGVMAERACPLNKTAPGARNGKVLV
jgi:hypothetical protein